MYTDLKSFVSLLQKENELIEIEETCSPFLEIAEINDRVVKNGGKALLFRNNTSEFPLLINAFGTEKRMCMALGVQQLDEIGKEFEQLFQLIQKSRNSLLSKMALLPEFGRLSSYFPRIKRGHIACQEVIRKEVDLSIFPILTCWPQDAGPFITLPIVHTLDPNTGVRNVGMYRMQVMDKSTTGMHWHLHKNAARHFDEYKKLGKRMPVTVTLGGDPVYTYVACSPLPDQMDEYLFAGFLRKKRVELVKCLSNDLEVPADSDIVIEGYIDPQETLALEGPFGDHTGFYSLPDYYPVFHVSCITHKKNAIYPTTVVGIPPQEDHYLAKATERIYLPLLRFILPEIIDLALPKEGCFHNLALVKIDKKYPGQGLKVIHALWGLGQMMNTKHMICFDQDVDIQNTREALQLFSKNISIPRDLLSSKGPLDALDHAGISFAFGGKTAWDATTKLTEELFEELTDVNETRSSEQNKPLQLKEVIPGVLFLFMEKNQEQTRWFWEEAQNSFPDKKIIIWVEESCIKLEDKDLLWYMLSNTEPQRDFKVISHSVLINGTRKNKSIDNIKRDWPEVLVMSESCIQTIDNKWEHLNLGAFIPSPSSIYKELKIGEEAACTED